MAQRITEVDKDDEGDITRLFSGTWESIATVIANIKRDPNRYYTEVRGRRAKVVVVPASRAHKEHLRSVPDGTTINNLDYL